MAVPHNVRTAHYACAYRWPLNNNCTRAKRKGFQGGRLVDKKDVRILVVDDEPTMADSLKQNLVEEGYSVDTAATGAEAIELFDQGGHHLAICDLHLPDIDGLEVMRHIKDARPTTEVIVVTGHGSVPKAVEATKAGAFDFVDKPFELEEIQPLVEKALERRELV